MSKKINGIDVKQAWKNRRRTLWVTLCYCAAIVVYCLVKGYDNEMVRSVVESAYLLSIISIGAYVFGAVTDDRFNPKNVMTIDGMTQGLSIRNSWILRRRTMWLAMLFCAGVVAYIVVHQLDTVVSRSIVQSSFLLTGSCLVSYVFGAVWDNKPLSSSKKVEQESE